MNLLPPQEREKIQKEVTARMLFVAGGIVIFWAVIFLVLLFNSVFYLDIQIPVLEGRLKLEQAAQKTNEVQNIENEIMKLNDALVKIEKIRQKKEFNHPYILRVLGFAVPAGAELNTISFTDGSMVVSGHAESRDEVLELEKELKAVEIFKDVDSPLSNIVKESDINFTFSFSINGQ